MNGLRGVCALTDLRSGLRVVVKVETRNESGSHKQRAAAAVVRAAQGDGHRAVTAGSCGNYGLALVIEAAHAGMSASIVLPRHAGGGRLQDTLVGLGADVHLAGDDYEDAVATSRTLAAKERIADGNVRGPYGHAVLTALSSIASELLDGLVEPPEAVWVPTGNGTTVTAIGLGLAAAGCRTATVAVTTRGNNSILASWPSRTHRPLPADRVATTHVRDPLVNRAALHGQEALDVLHARSGLVLGVDDEDLIASQALLAAAGVRCSPAAAAGLAGLLASEPTSAVHGDHTHVIVVTGR